MPEICGYMYKVLGIWDQTRTDIPKCMFLQQCFFLGFLIAIAMPFNTADQAVREPIKEVQPYNETISLIIL